MFPELRREKERQLRSKYRDRALAPETLFLLNASDALAFLGDAEAVGLILAGVEGFRITDLGAYEPRQEFSNDSADVRCSREEFFEATRALIRKGAPLGIRFEVVFENLI